jgi:beta-glucosidase
MWNLPRDNLKRNTRSGCDWTGPERELRGFEKVSLAPGETKHVTLSLDARAFSYWDEAKHGWTIDSGKFVIHVGDSSENTPLHADLTIN